MPTLGSSSLRFNFDLLAGYGHLFVQYSVFRTAGDIQYLYFHFFLYLRKSPEMNLRGQWFPYQVAEVHGSQAESILGFSDAQFTFIQFHLHFQHIILRFKSMFVGTSTFF